MDTRKEIESLAHLHEGFPLALTEDLQALLVRTTSPEGRRVVTYAAKRAQEAADKLRAVKAQLAQARAAVEAKTAYLESLKTQLETLQRAPLELFDKRYK